MQISHSQSKKAVLGCHAKVVNRRTRQCRRLVQRSSGYSTFQTAPFYLEPVGSYDTLCVMGVVLPTPYQTRAAHDLYRRWVNSLSLTE